MQEIFDFIFNNGVVIIVGCFIIGEIIKKSLSFIPNQMIPLIGGVLGIVAALLIPSVFPEVDTGTKIIYGLACGWAATGGYETIRNLPELFKKGE